MIIRTMALAFGVAGAAALSQFPEFAQQYLQRLAGKVDQLEVQVTEVDAAAASFDMTRAAYLEDLSGTQTGAAAAARAAADIALYERLSSNIAGVRDASAWGRLVGAYGVADVSVARRTWADYQPAMPLTVEGLGFAALGFGAGYGIWSLLWSLLSWPRRRRAAAQLALVPTYDARFEEAPSEFDDDEAPFLEYEGDIARAMTQRIPPLTLAAHDGSVVDLAMLTAPTAIFTYPLMGRPGVAYPKDWLEVDEADNATALACSFRDAYDMMRRAGIGEVFGLSAQNSADQSEAAHRLALPYTLLSDPRMSFAFELDLPRFVLHHERYFAPAVLVVQAGRILAALHPVKDAATAATRLLAKLEQARQAHQKAQFA